MNNRALLRVSFLCTVLSYLLFVDASKARADLSTADPLGFFTNLSSRLLKSETGLDLHWIQIYPTNQYTPGVHRLLQVVANIYDARTNRHDDFGPLPTVFAPRFTVSNNAVYITGFIEVLSTNDLSPIPPLDLGSLATTNLSSVVTSNSLIFGVPLVIGARKGLPNFNECATDAFFTLSRKIQLVKSSPGGQNNIVGTNQFFVLDCAFASGVEYWNSYVASYSRPVEILVYNQMSMSLTNDLGVNIPLTITTTGSCALTTIGTNIWSGWTNHEYGKSFIAPLRTNITLLPSVAYLPSLGVFLPSSNTIYDTNQTLDFPRWHLAATNRVHGMILDLNTRQIVDHVLLDDMIFSVDLGAEIGRPPSLSLSGLWSTNEMSGRPGVLEQIRISRGAYPDLIDQGEWSAAAQDERVNDSFISAAQQIANFVAFFTPNNRFAYVDQSTGRTYLATNTSLVTPVPFSPSLKLALTKSWQANDPLVHAFSAELSSSSSSVEIQRIKPPSLTNFFFVTNIGHKNQRYKPWETFNVQSPEAYNAAIADPLIYASDSWQFPIGGCTTVDQLSQIHRGTPWQTIYLKSGTANISAWQNWLGILTAEDAQLSHPTRDWASTWLIASLFRTNNPGQLMSVNEPNTNAWLRALDGFTALTNTSSQPSSLQPPQFDTLSMASNSPQAGNITASIFATRANKPGGVFRDVGELLASTALSTASPWLNQSTTSHTRYGISDEAYERIPSQLLSLVRPDSVGTLVSSNGNWLVQFSGFDSCSYAVDRSSDLLNWTAVSTNYPTNGGFSFPVSVAGNQFFRSRLLP